MPSQTLAAVVGACAAMQGHGLRTSKSWTASGLDYSFHDFVADFKRPYEEGSDEWNMRKELFSERMKDIVEFNSEPDRSWKKGVTQFIDHTVAERYKVLGYTGRGTRRSFGALAQATFLFGRTADIPPEFSVELPDGKFTRLVRDQGNCGSCWADAATTVLEGHLEANRTAMSLLQDLHAKNAGVPKVPTLSSQAMLSCTPNPRHCGGKGGCNGATVELAYEMVKGHGGIPFAVEWPYASGGNGIAPECNEKLFPTARVAITGYSQLPSNRLSPLKQALVESGGPIAVSVDATNWFAYMGGIFSDKDFERGGDFTVNHAVTLVGYKEAEPRKGGYWTIKNSWGDLWGEDGKIRLEMKAREEEHCGWDYNTHDGVACDGDPDKAWVCGTCGVLYDSTYPTGVHLKTA